MSIVINGTTYNRAMQNGEKVSVLFNSNKVIDSFPNLLVNSGFETGDLTSWTGSSWSIDSSASRSGSHSLTTTSNTELINTTEITAVKGHTLRFSFYAKSSGSTGYFYKSVLGWNGSSWVAFTPTSDNNWPVLGSDWTLQSFDYKCDGTYSKIRFRTIPYNPDSNALWVDDCSVKDISRPLITAWTGAENASTSTLSQDGQVVATNILENPKPVSNGDVYWNAGVTVSDTGDGMMLTYTTGDSALFDIKAPVLPSTQYVIGAELVALANATTLSYQGALLVYTVDANKNILNTYPENGDYHLGIHSRTITTEANAAYVVVRLFCPNNTSATATWRNAGVYTQSDWQAMQARSVTWFSGDSYARNND